MDEDDTTQDDGSDDGSSDAFNDAVANVVSLAGAASDVIQAVNSPSTTVAANVPSTVPTAPLKPKPGFFASISTSGNGLWIALGGIVLVLGLGFLITRK